METLRERHKLSTPYYPQSNGKVKHVIGTLKSMLRRMVTVAAQAQGATEHDAVKVFGVGLDLDDKIIDAIASAQSDVQAN